MVIKGDIRAEMRLARAAVVTRVKGSAKRVKEAECLDTCLCWDKLFSTRSTINSADAAAAAVFGMPAVQNGATPARASWVTLMVRLHCTPL